MTQYMWFQRLTQNIFYILAVLAILDLVQFSRGEAMNKVITVPAFSELTSYREMTDYRRGDMEKYNTLGMIYTLNKKNIVEME